MCTEHDQKTEMVYLCRGQWSGVLLMFKFFIKRLLAALPMLLVMSVVTFAIIQAPPGDYADLIKSQSMTFGGLSEADAQRIADQYRAQYGLDDPIVVQYARWITGIVTEADFGYSFQHNKPVSELIGERFPRTLGIALVCHILATLIGAGLGIYAASNQYKLGDQISTVLSFIGMTIPRFVLALIMLYWLVFIMNVSAFGNLYSPEYAFAPWSWAKFVDLVKHIWACCVYCCVWWYGLQPAGYARQPAGRFAGAIC